MTMPHLCPGSSALNITAGMMALQVHPTIPSNFTPKQVFDSDTSILHALSSYSLTITFQYCIITISILPTITQDRQEAGYNILYFTHFLAKATWTRLYLDQSVTNKISTRLPDTNPLPIPYLFFQCKHHQYLQPLQFIIPNQNHLSTLR